MELGLTRVKLYAERNSFIKFILSRKQIHSSLILFIALIITKAHPVKLFQLPSQAHHQQVTSEQSVSSTQAHETQCLACIRNVTSAGIDLTKRCDGYFCGPYQFNYQYWAEAGKPGRSDGVREFDKCARDTSCAELTIKAYFKRYKRDCNNDGQIDCLDMAALHKAGPASCSQDRFFKSRYWQAFMRTRCATDKDFSSVAKESNVPMGEPKVTIDSKNTKTHVMIMKNQTLTSECLDCICESLSSCGSGGNSAVVNANNCGSGTICGPFAISQSYWKDGRRPGASWTACTRTKECSIVTIKNYMDRHKRDCNGDGLITCEDYAAVHRRGPKACMNRDLYKEQYWTKFLNCRANQKPKDDATLVRAGDESNDQHSPTMPAIDDKEKPTVGAQTGAAHDRTTPTKIQSTSDATTTQTTPHSTTMSASSFQSSTRSDRPNQVDGPHFVISTINSATENEGGSRIHHSSLSPYDTYELNPISIATKPDRSESQSATYQTITTAQHIYEDHYASNKQDDRLADKNIDDPQRAQPSASSLADTSLLISSSTRPISDSTTSSGSNSSENDDRVSLSTTQSHEYHDQSANGEDYNSLPIIIVGKPLGSLSTSRISQSPQMQVPSSFAQPDSHESHSVEQQYQSTRVMSQKPTTSSLQVTTTTTRPSYSIDDSSRGSSIVHEQSSSTNSLPMITKPSDLIRSTILLNQEEPIDADYLVHDLGPIGFDRVVNGIVANPDFSKSYPPMPNHLIQQRKQMTSTSVQPPRGPTLQMHRKEQTSSTVSSHRNIARDPSQLEALDGKRELGKKENLSPTTSPKDDQSAQIADLTVQKTQSNLPSGSSDSSLANVFNLTNLLGDGSRLNESNRIPSECLDCICDASSNCDPTVQCISKQREKNRCGLYMISWNQYKESDIELVNLMSSSTTSPGKGSEDQDERLYYECSTDKSCAEKLIHLYIEKYSKDCNNDGIIDCFDIAALHRVGPDQCNSDKFLRSQYWRDFNHCYATDRLTTTMMPQQAG